MLYWELFVTFFKIGLFTFGGGYAMIALITAACVEKKGWITHDDMMHITVIAETTPGPIAINCATFVGQKHRGTAGALFCTLGVVFPSLVIITLIAAFLSNFAHLPVVQNAFAGVRVCVCVLIFNAVTKLWKKSVKDKVGVVICLAVFLVSVIFEVSPVLCVLLAGVAGVVINTRRWAK